MRQNVSMFRMWRMRKSANLRREQILFAVQLRANVEHEFGDLLQSALLRKMRTEMKRMRKIGTT